MISSQSTALSAWPENTGPKTIHDIRNGMILANQIVITPNHQKTDSALDIFTLSIESRGIRYAT